ncbi:MAG: HlyC/CorC family transporter [Candidatus Cloacimonetes bacterium]|nr:HlyC/CorC family transporter [Candidatus Cloacimonadota bacterium]
MPWGTILLFILAFLFLLVLSFLFSGFETGVISINKIKLERDAKRNRSRAHLLAFLSHSERVLGTTLLGNNIVNVLLASLAAVLSRRLFVDFFDPRWASLAVGTLVLVLGEIMPKTIFRDNAEKLVPPVYPIIRFFSLLFKPFVILVSRLNLRLGKLLKLKQSNDFAYLTKDDLAFLLSQTETDSETAEAMEMIGDALDFNELDARNIMIPRTEVIGIPETATLPEIMEIARTEGFTRYPVYCDTLDNIVGVLIIYDILKQDCREDMTAGGLMRDALFVPENTDLDVLLKDMQHRQRSMAIVVDAYGGTAGIVTMEDILEEIVGDIEDEYDEDEETPEVVQVNPNTWLVMADMEIDRLADEYGIELPEGDYETVAGLILDTLERIPHQGQYLTLGKLRLQILQATDKKIIKVKIHNKEV